VLNGIAWDSRNDTLLVTGKFWPHLYRLKLLQPLP
jgi:glutamine cyclotransferase